jgi:hypothetical protein
MSLTINWNDVWSTTLMNYRQAGEMYDNIFLENPTMRFFHAKGRKKTEDGGTLINIPIQVTKNSTGGSYSGYDVIDVTPQDNQRMASYYWKQYGISIVIDGLSQFQNKSPHKMIDLLDTKVKEAEETMVEDINEQLWAASPGTKDTGSIPGMIPLAPSTTDAYEPGGISGATYSYWRNQASSSSASTFIALVREAKHLYRLCKQGVGGFPNGAICDLTTFELINNAIEDKTRYVDPDLAPRTKRSPVVENMRFMGATMWWDDHVGDAYGNGTTAYDWDNASVTYGSLYFINTKYLYYVVGEGKDLKVGRFATAQVAGHDASIALITHYHQLVCKQRRKHGVLYKIDKTIAS